MNLFIDLFSTKEKEKVNKPILKIISKAIISLFIFDFITKIDPAYG